MKEFFYEEFQYEAIKAILEDMEVMPAIYKVLDQNAFSNIGARIVVGIIKEYYKKNGYVPDEVALKLKVKETVHNDDDYAKAINAIAQAKVASPMGRETVKESLIKFFQAKSLVKMANLILESATKNDDVEKMITKCKKGFDDIYKASPAGEITTTLTTDTVKNVLMGEEGEVIPTGIKKIDAALAGGLGRQEIGLFVAPTGYGKTTAGTIFAHNAASDGYKVLQIYFEDKPQDIIRKHLAMMVGDNTRNLKGLDESDADSIIQGLGGEIDKIGENLVITKMGVGTTTVEDIEMKIRMMITNSGFKPDMVVIDYFSCLKMSTNPTKNTWEAEANAMRKIKEMAFKYNMAIWVLQQTNRTAVTKDGDSDTMGNWQGSYAATQPASVWLLLKRTKEQKQNFRADILFLKTRHSQPREDLLDIKFDNARLVIDCDDSVMEEANNKFYEMIGNEER